MSPKPEDRPGNQISVIVIVGGVETPVTVNVNNKVEAIVREALHESGNVGQPPDQWALSLDGVTLQHDDKVAETPITNGATLYLAPVRGEGG